MAETVRVKDSQAPTRLNFHGLHWYDPDPRYRVEARWIPFVPVKEIKIPSIIGVTDEMPAPGLAEFTLDGHSSWSRCSRSRMRSSFSLPCVTRPAGLPLQGLRQATAWPAFSTPIFPTTDWISRGA